MRLRLLLTEECNRRCRLCCNRGWDLASLPVCEDFRGYDEILLTGGEPLLKPALIRHVVREIRAQDEGVPVYLYTAMLPGSEILEVVDGVTMTLHTKADVVPFLDWYASTYHLWRGKSMRLNVFAPIRKLEFPNWRVKNHMRWIKDCPLPTDEVFMRYE